MGPTSKSALLCAALSAALLIFSCASASAPVKNASSVSPEEAARADFAEAEDAIGKNQAARAEKLLGTFLARYPGSALASRAKKELGKILYDRKQFARAAEMFSAIPWKEVPANERPELEKLTRSAFGQAPNDRTELYWLIAVLDTEEPGTPNMERRREITGLIDRALSRDDLKNLARQRENLFPADYAAFRTAKLAQQAGAFAEAREWASLFLTRFPNHESAAEARRMSEALKKSDEADPLAVGLLLPLTGMNQIYASQVLNGAALAAGLFEPGRGGGVRIYMEDAGDSPEKAASAVAKLATEHQVIAAAGPLFSKESQAASAAAMEYGLPIISMSPAEGITNIGETVFQNSLTKSEQAEALARLATEKLGIKRAAILHPKNNYGTEFMSFFRDEFTKRGGEIRRVESYDPESSDFSVPIKRLVRIDPEARADKLTPDVDFEAIFIPDGYEKTTQIVPALAYYNVRGVTVLGTNLLNTPDVFRGRSGEYMQGAVFLDGFFKDRKEGAARAFVQKFRSTFGTEPGVLEAQAYDTVSILIDTINRNRPSGRHAMAQALQKVKDFPGATGETSFGPLRDARRTLTPLTIDGDRIVELQ